MAYGQSSLTQTLRDPYTVDWKAWEFMRFHGRTAVLKEIDDMREAGQADRALGYSLEVLDPAGARKAAQTILSTRRYSYMARMTARAVELLLGDARGIGDVEKTSFRPILTCWLLANSGIILIFSVYIALQSVVPILFMAGIIPETLG